MPRILRGEIRWADLNPVRGREQAGQRPVLILSQDVFNERSGTVIGVALTSQPQRAGFPLTLEVHAKGLPKKSWVARQVGLHVQVLDQRQRIVRRRLAAWPRITSMAR